MMSVSLETEIENSFAAGLIIPGSEPATFRLYYHRILLVGQAEGILRIDDQSYVLGKNQAFLISKGQIIDFHSVTSIDGVQTVFGDSFWFRAPRSTNNCKAALFDQGSDQHCLELNESEMAGMSAVFQLLITEFQATAYINQLDVLAAYLKIIVIKFANIASALKPGFENFDKQTFHNFMTLLKTGNRRQKVGAYAYKLNITTTRLTDICKRISGQSAKDHIKDQTLIEAKRRLQFSNDLIKEISYDLGFATVEQFGIFFKRYADVTPSNYRLNSTTVPES